MEFVLGLLFQRKLSSKKPPLAPSIQSFFPPLFIPLIVFWSVGSANALLLAWKLSGCQLVKPFPNPSPCSLCSCSRTQRHSAQESHQMFPLSTLLIAPDLLSRDSRVCPVFIGIFFMFYFIVWCPLYENNPLKMLLLEQNRALVQHGAADQEGKKNFQTTELQDCDTDVKTSKIISLEHERCLETEPSPG